MSFFTFFRPSKVLIFYIVYGLFVIGFIEIFLIALYQLPEISEVWHAAVKDFYKRNIRNNIQYDPNCSEYDPVLSYRLRKEGCIFAGKEFHTEIKANSARLRGYEENLHGAEVVVLGDSFSFGWGVEYEETYSNQLSKLTGKKVLNVSMASYGTARELLALEPLSVKSGSTLIIQFCENDQDENINFISNKGELDIMSLSKYEELTGINQGSQNYYPGKFIRHLPNMVISIFKAPPKTEEERSQSAKDKVKVLLRVLDFKKNLLLKFDRIIIFELNEWRLLNYLFAHELEAALNSNKSNDLFNRIIPWDVSRSLIEDDFFIYDDHINPSGHKKIAQSLSAFFVQ